MAEPGCTSADRRRQQGQPPAAVAQRADAGPPRRAGRERPRRARDAAARTVRPAAARYRDARDGRLCGARAAEGRPAVARPAGDRDLVGRGAGQHRALHRPGRRGLPAQAGEPGAAEGAHRRQPGEEAPARPAEGTGAALRHLRGGAGPAAIGFRARRQARARVGDVFRHPRLHGAGGEPAAGRDDRTAQHLLHADVRRHQQPRRGGQPDDRRRADGAVRRAAAARRLRRQRGGRGAGNDRADRAIQPGAQRGAEANDPHRHRHRHRRRRGRLHRHAAARHVHLHRRHGQPGGTAGGAHQGSGARHPDRRRHTTRVERRAHGGPGRRALQGQDRCGGDFCGGRWAG